MSAWTVTQHTIPLDVLTVPRTSDMTREEWFRIPSWRIEFNAEALRGMDVRVHKSVGIANGWTISEATTGFKIYDGWGDHETPDEVLDLFCELSLPKITREVLDAAFVKARDEMAHRTPAPWAERDALLAALEHYITTDNGPGTRSMAEAAVAKVRGKS